MKRLLILGTIFVFNFTVFTQAQADIKKTCSLAIQATLENWNLTEVKGVPSYLKIVTYTKKHVKFWEKFSGWKQDRHLTWSGNAAVHSSRIEVVTYLYTGYLALKIQGDKTKEELYSNIAYATLLTQREYPSFNGPSTYSQISSQVEVQVKIDDTGLFFSNALIKTFENNKAGLRENLLSESEYIQLNHWFLNQVEQNTDFEGSNKWVLFGDIINTKMVRR